MLNKRKRIPEAELDIMLIIWRENRRMTRAELLQRSDLAGGISPPGKPVFPGKAVRRVGGAFDHQPL